MTMSINQIFKSSMSGKKADPKCLFLISSVLTLLTVVLLIGFIFAEALPVFMKEGIGFIINSEWSYDKNSYGIFPFIVSTLVLTVMTMIMTVPLGILTAIFLSEFSPKWLTSILRPMIELLVGIPSIVYGIFGVFVLSKLFRDYINPAIDSGIGFIPLFRIDNAEGLCMLLAAVVLTVMVLPTMTVITQESLRSVSKELRDGSYALGLTKWETVKKLLIPIALPGITAAFILSMMRAMGETMAVLMLTGGLQKIPTSVLSTGTVMTSKIVAEAGEYIGLDMPRSALFGIAAVLFLMEIGLVGAVRIISRKKI